MHQGQSKPQELQATKNSPEQPRAARVGSPALAGLWRGNPLKKHPAKAPAWEGTPALAGESLKKTSRQSSRLGGDTLYVCTHTHTPKHIHAHTYIYTNRHTDAHTYTCTFTRTYIHTRTHIRTHIHMHTHTYTETHTCKHTTHKHIHIDIHAYADIHTHYKVLIEGRFDAPRPKQAQGATSNQEQPRAAQSSRGGF